MEKEIKEKPDKKYSIPEPCKKAFNMLHGIETLLSEPIYKADFEDTARRLEKLEKEFKNNIKNCSQEGEFWDTLPFRYREFKEQLQRAIKGDHGKISEKIVNQYAEKAKRDISSFVKSILFDLFVWDED